MQQKTRQQTMLYSKPKDLSSHDNHYKTNQYQRENNLTNTQCLNCVGCYSLERGRFAPNP